MTRLRWATVIFCTLFLVQYQPPYACSEEQAPLAIEIRTTKESFTLPEPISIEAIVRNISSRNISFCTRDLRPPFHLLKEGVCEIRDLNNRRVLCGLRLEASLLRKDEFIILEPGMSKVFTFNLYDSPLDQLTQGEYTVTWYYYGRDSWYEGSTLTSAEYPWRGRLVSNALRIRLVETDKPHQ